MKLKLYIPDCGSMSRALRFVLSAHVVEEMGQADVVIVCDEALWRKLLPEAESNHEFILFTRVKPVEIIGRTTWAHVGEPLVVFLSYLQAMEGARESYEECKRERQKSGESTFG